MILLACNLLTFNCQCHHAEHIVRKAVSFGFQSLSYVGGWFPAQIWVRGLESSLYAPSSHAWMFKWKQDTRAWSQVCFPQYTALFNLYPLLRYRQILMFRRDTIRRFSRNALEMRRIAPHDFEDLLQVSDNSICSFSSLPAIPVCHACLWWAISGTAQYIGVEAPFHALLLAWTHQTANSCQWNPWDPGCCYCISWERALHIQCSYVSDFPDPWIEMWNRTSVTPSATASVTYPVSVLARAIHIITSTQDFQFANIQVTCTQWLCVVDQEIWDHGFLFNTAGMVSSQLSVDRCCIIIHRENENITWAKQDFFGQAAGISFVSSLKLKGVSNVYSIFTREWMACITLCKNLSLVTLWSIIRLENRKIAPWM